MASSVIVGRVGVSTADWLAASTSPLAISASQMATESVNELLQKVPEFQRCFAASVS